MRNSLFLESCLRFTLFGYNWYLEMTKQLHSVCRTYPFFQRWALHQLDKPWRYPNNVHDNLASTKEGFLNSLNNVQHIIETFIKVLELVCSFWQVAITWGIFIKKHFFWETVTEEGNSQDDSMTETQVSINSPEGPSKSMGMKFLLVTPFTLPRCSRRLLLCNQSSSDTAVTLQCD